MSTKAAAQIDALLEIASKWTLIRTPDDMAYCLAGVNGKRLAIPVDSRPFSDALSTAHKESAGSRPKESQLAEAVGMVAREARSSGLLRPVFTRLGSSGESVFLDLGDADGQIAEITKDGWRLVEMSSVPVLFHRPPGMRPLPIPSPTGTIDCLWPILAPGCAFEARTEAQWEDFYLVTAWLTGCLHPVGPYPVAVIQGEQGSGKSFRAYLLKWLIDPSTSTLQMIPTDRRELMVTARHAHVLSFDNLSGLEKDMADAICSLSTGTAMNVRRLYSNDEMETFCATRPVILNGIDSLVGRGDLTDRAVVFDMPAIADKSRLDDKYMRDAITTVHGEILGGLLNGAVAAIKGYQSVVVENIPRMADFAKWAVAAESVYWETPKVIAAYTKNREEAQETILEADPVAEWVLQLAKDRFISTINSVPTDVLECSASELLGIMPATRSRSWPDNPRSLVNRLLRLAPTFRRAGLKITRHRSVGRRYITFEYRVPVTRVPQVPMSADNSDPIGTELFPPAV